MRALVLCLVLLAMQYRVHGQERIMMYPGFGSVHYEYEKDTAAYQVTPRQVGQILFDYPEAYREFKKARTHSTLAGICGFIGAGLMAIPVTTAILGGTPEWSLAAGGGALVITSIPLSRSYRRKAQHSIDLFNARHSSFRLDPRLQFWGSGARLIIRF